MTLSVSDIRISTLLNRDPFVTALTPEICVFYQKYTINKYPVYKTFGNTHGLHAIGLSRSGCKELLDFSTTNDHKYMDCILGKFIKNNHANIIRYDLESYISGHRGIFFQNRRKFPTTI